MKIEEKDGTFTANLGKILVGYICESRTFKVVLTETGRVLRADVYDHDMTLPEFKDVVEKYNKLICCK